MTIKMLSLSHASFKKNSKRKESKRKTALEKQTPSQNAALGELLCYACTSHECHLGKAKVLVASRDSSVQLLAKLFIAVVLGKIELVETRVARR